MKNNSTNKHQMTSRTFGFLSAICLLVILTFTVSIMVLQSHQTSSRQSVAPSDRSLTNRSVARVPEVTSSELETDTSPSTSNQNIDQVQPQENSNPGTTSAPSARSSKPARQQQTPTQTQAPTSNRSSSIESQTQQPRDGTSESNPGQSRSLSLDNVIRSVLPL